MIYTIHVRHTHTNSKRKIDTFKTAESVEAFKQSVERANKKKKNLAQSVLGE